MLTLEDCPRAELMRALVVTMYDNGLELPQDDAVWHEAFHSMQEFGIIPTRILMLGSVSWEACCRRSHMLQRELEALRSNCHIIRYDPEWEDRYNPHMIAEYREILSDLLGSSADELAAAAEIMYVWNELLAEVQP